MPKDGIEIVIRKDGTSINSGVPETGNTGSSIEPGKPNEVQKQANALIISYGRQMIQQGYHIISDIQGNKLVTSKIDGMTNLAADILMIAKGGAIGAIAVGFKYTTQVINQTIDYQREVNRINAQNVRLGNIVELGGRYTNG